MDDLIRRSDAKSYVTQAWAAGVEPPSKYIDMIPAVDAVEVVHAHWEDGNKSIRNPTGYAFNWWCSRCGKPQYSPVAKNLEEFTKDNPYCHKCGARMDGQRREDGDA